MSKQLRKTSHSFLLVALFALSAAFVGRAFAAGPKPELLQAIPAPRILVGDEHTAYRDPLLFHDGNTFYLFYAYVKEEEEHLIYWYVAVSTSSDLQHWSAPKLLTPKDQNLNYSSPGSVTRFGKEWILTLQRYPSPGSHRGDPLRFGTDASRPYLMRSRDLKTWSAPELIPVLGPTVADQDMGKTIDPFILRDKDDPSLWWCFYKRNGKVVSSTSRDLKVWKPTGLELAEGENPDVFVEGNEYVLLYAPPNGIGFKRSADLKTWHEDGPIVTLGQKDWPWAETRLTAGYVDDLRSVRGVGKYVMVSHSMGPGKKKREENVNANCSIVIAWSDDLKTWHWPGEVKP